MLRRYVTLAIVAAAAGLAAGCDCHKGLCRPTPPPAAAACCPTPAAPCADPLAIPNPGFQAAPGYPTTPAYPGAPIR